MQINPTTDEQIPWLKDEAEPQTWKDLIELSLYPSIEIRPSECHLRISQGEEMGLDTVLLYNFQKEKLCSKY